MQLDEPRLVPRDAFERVRPCLPVSARFDALWVSGDIDGLVRPTVAIVGSRAPSDGGRRLAFETARGLAGEGFCIVSGLALGVDGAAHGGALDAGIPTVGILGGGHRCFHPKRNRPLAERMLASGGAVISPFPPDHAAHPPQFLQRNGIIAALADAVVIVEAAARSGALNTASWAADLSIPVFAFPGDVDRPKVAGCLALLRDGAMLVRNAADILEDLGHAPQSAEHEGPQQRIPGIAGRSPLEHMVLSALSDGEATLDDLLARAAGAPASLLAALTALEISGIVERRPGQRFGLVSAGGKTGAAATTVSCAVPSVVRGTRS